MTISLGCDHAGYPLKARLIAHLEMQKHTVIDHGCYDNSPVDFPDIAKKVCETVVAGKAERGIMLCGSGVGASIACNKVRGIRAFCCHDAYSAHQSVEHDDVNVACIGADVVGPQHALDLITFFLDAKFSEGEEFRQRVCKLGAMEAKW